MLSIPSHPIGLSPPLHKPQQKHQVAQSKNPAVDQPVNQKFYRSVRHPQVGIRNNQQGVKEQYKAEHPENVRIHAHQGNQRFFKHPQQPEKHHGAHQQGRKSRAHHSSLVLATRKKPEKSRFHPVSEQDVEKGNPHIEFGIDRVGCRRKHIRMQAHQQKHHHTRQNRCQTVDKSFFGKLLINTHANNSLNRHLRPLDA